jgi:capsid protein
MPYNVAAGNSSGYNYASGRLDHQSYFKAIKVDQHFTGGTVLDPILRAWLDLYHGWSNDYDEPVKGPLPRPSPSGSRLPPHQWFWDGMEHVDPSKEANALVARLSCGATSYAAEFGRQGKDYAVEMAKQAEALGVTLPEYQALLRKKLFGAELPASDEGSGEPESPEEEYD